MRKNRPHARRPVPCGANRKADAALIQQLRRVASNETFDESPLAELDSEALDFRAASESFPRGGRLKKADLQTLRLLTAHGRRLVPTVGGLLLPAGSRTMRSSLSQELKTNAVVLDATRRGY